MVAQKKDVQEQEIATKDKLLLGLKGENRFMLLTAVLLIVVAVALAIIFINLLLVNSKNPAQNSTWNNPTNNESGNNIPTTATSSLPPKPTPIPTPKPTPTPRPLPYGPQTYSVGSRNSIQVKNLTISELNTRVGDPQSMTLTIADSEGKIVSVSVKMITDNKSQTNMLARTSTTDTEELWQGTWKTIDDTYNVNLQAQITIKDDKGNTFSFTPTFR